MEHDAAGPMTPHDTVAARVRDLRKARGWSAERLAQEMTAVGVPWERMVVTKLETGRRQSVSVAELFALGYVLDVAPVHLLVPIEDDEIHQPYSAVPAEPPVEAWQVRNWIRGTQLIGRVDKRRYFSQVPPSEFAANTFTRFGVAGGDDDGR